MIASIADHARDAISGLDQDQGGQSRRRPLPLPIDLLEMPMTAPSAWRGSARRRRGLDGSVVRARCPDMSSTRATALALIAQYGGDAETIAMLRAAEFAAQGDVQGLADWDAIIADIRRLDEEGPGSGALN